MKKTIIEIIISNAVTLIVFYLMYRWGADNIKYVQQYYKIPLAVVITYMFYENLKELRVASELNK